MEGMDTGNKGGKVGICRRGRGGRKIWKGDVKGGLYVCLYVWKEGGGQLIM